MGSYQYSTLRSAFAVSAEVGTVPEAWLLAVRHWETPQPRAMPAATSATATTVFLKTVLVMLFSLQSAIRLFRRAITVSRCACSSMSRQHGAQVTFGGLVVGQREFNAPLCQAHTSRLQPLDLAVQ